MVFNDETNEIKGNIDGNTTKIYNHNNGNSSSNSRRLKLISFSINDKSSHFKQLTKLVIII